MSCPLFEEYTQFFIDYFPEFIIYSNFNTCESKEYKKLLKRCGMIYSISQKGDCRDNAVVKSFFHILKTELTNETLYHS